MLIPINKYWEQISALKTGTKKLSGIANWIKIGFESLLHFASHILQKWNDAIRVKGKKVRAPLGHFYFVRNNTKSSKMFTTFFTTLEVPLMAPSAAHSVEYIHIKVTTKKMIFFPLNTLFHFGDYATKRKSFTIVNSKKGAGRIKKKKCSLVDIFRDIFIEIM